MTIGEAILSSSRMFVLGIFFLLLTGQMALAIASFRDWRSRRIRLALLASFFLGAVIFWLCMSIVSWENNYPGGGKSHPAWLAEVYTCPLWAVVIYDIVTAAVLIFAARDTFLYRKSHVTPDSVKQAMDLLPVGVAFSGQDGTVLFRNVVMDRISVARTGKLLTDINSFGVVNGEQVSLFDKTWHFAVQETTGSSFIQLTATDITEQARILANLEEKNRKLTDINLRLKIYNRQAERIIIAQEMLTARMTVHDELGHILLESRHYLNNPDAFNKALLLQLLKNTNACLLREYDQDDTARDALADAIDMAEAIGVDVTIVGRVPLEEPGRSLLAAAIQECAANAVKHADGSALMVRIRREENEMLFSLENNGVPPSGPIRESGGLLSLRDLTEKKGGRMELESMPAFHLTLFLPDTAGKSSE